MAMIPKINGHSDQPPVFMDEHDVG